MLIGDSRLLKYAQVLLDMLLTTLSWYLLCSLASFRGSAVESGIWIWLRACVCGKHFLCRNAAIGMEAEGL